METVIRKRKRKRSAKRVFIALAVIVTAAAVSLALINSALRGPIIGTARERVRELTSRAMNEAVIRVLEREGVFMPSLESTVTGGTVTVTADTAKLNLIVTEITHEAQELIEELGTEGVSIGLGAAMGLVPLSGSGPEVRAAFAPTGSVVSEVSSKLRSAGVNQSLFSVELTLTASVRFTAAGANEEVSVTASSPLIETVLLGQVPQVYTNVANEDDMLNLIPTELP